MKATKDTKQIIALILATISILMLFLPWMTLGKLRDAIKVAKDYGYTAKELAGDYFDSILDLVPAEKRKQADKTIKALSDGRLSASETVGFSRTISTALGKMKEYHLDEFTDDSTRSGLNIARIVLALYPWLFWLTLLLGIVSLISRLIKSKSGAVGKIYAVLQVVMLLFFIIFSIALNKIFKNWVGMDFGISITFFSVFAVLLTLFATPVGGLIAKLLPDSAAAPAVQPAAAAAAVTDGWRCSCGKLNADTTVFCGQCGSQKPGYKNCPQCGQPVPAEKTFCGKCGAKL